MLFFFFGTHRHSSRGMLLLWPWPSLLLLFAFMAVVNGEEEDRAGFGDHKVKENTAEVSSDWVRATEGNWQKIRETYGKCADDVNVTGNHELTFTYKKGSESATAGCTFDLTGSKEFLSFTAEVDGDLSCLRDAGNDVAEASEWNALPFAINAINPRAKGLCFKRYGCQNDDKRTSIPCIDDGEKDTIGNVCELCEKVGQTKGSLCRVGCLRSPLYEISWAKEDESPFMHMTLVGDPQFCMYLNLEDDGGGVDVEFGEENKNFIYTIKNTLNEKSTEKKYAGNNLAYCLETGALPKSTKNWKRTDSEDKGYLSTFHLMPQEMLYDRSLSGGDYSKLYIEKKTAIDRVPNCNISIKMKHTNLLVRRSPAGDTTAPTCGGGHRGGPNGTSGPGGADGNRWWLWVAIGLGSLLLLETGGFLLWLFLVRWRKRGANPEVGGGAKTLGGMQKSGMKTTAGGSQKSGMQKSLGRTTAGYEKLEDVLPHVK